MILRRASRIDPGLVFGSATPLLLALALPFGIDLGNCAAFAQAPAAQTPVAPAPTTAAAPTGADALKLHDQELQAARARQRETVESQAKLRLEIEALSADRRKLNEQLIDTAAQLREVEANIDATQARLAPLDEREQLFQKSLDERRTVIAEILAALQRMGRQPPPALIVRPEDALQAVRT